MKLTHMHQLMTLYLRHGSKVNQRSFEVTGSKGHFNQKDNNSTIKQHGHETYTYASACDPLSMYGSKVNQSSFEVKGVKSNFYS